MGKTAPLGSKAASAGGLFHIRPSLRSRLLALRVQVVRASKVRLWKAAHACSIETQGSRHPTMTSQCSEHKFVPIESVPRKISSQYAFDCFASRAPRFSPAVDVLTFFSSDPRQASGFVSRNVQNK
jgi:hypothetical protein